MVVPSLSIKPADDGLLTVMQVVIVRDKEDTKRYDFEAQSVGDAAEIVEEIQRGMEPYDQQHVGRS